MSVKIRLRRGSFTNLPTTGLQAGEALWSSDRGTLHVASDATTTVPVVPAIDELTSFSSPATGDHLIMHDVDESGGGLKEKRITFANFKTALNIPAASSDELVAASDGTTSGYLDEVLVAGDGTIDLSLVANDLEITVPTGGITATQLATDAVTTVKIDDSAVTSAKINASAITTTKINDTAVTTAKLADDAVTSAKAADALLDLSSAFSGTGIDTQLDIAEVDGGSF